MLNDSPLDEYLLNMDTLADLGLLEHWLATKMPQPDAIGFHLLEKALQRPCKL
jgi:hypothetical protein